MKYYVFANDEFRFAECGVFKFNRQKFIIERGCPIAREDILPVDTVDHPNHNSRCINVGAHGTLRIRIRDSDWIIGTGTLPEWLLMPLSLLSKVPGESTGGSVFPTVRLHGN